MQGITFLENLEKLENDGVGITVNHNGVPTRFAFDFANKLITADSRWTFFDTNEIEEMQEYDGEDVNAEQYGEDANIEEDSQDNDEAEEEVEQNNREDSEGQYEEEEDDREEGRSNVQLNVQVDIPSLGGITLNDYKPQVEDEFSQITKKVNEILCLARGALRNQRKANKRLLNRK